MKTMSKIKMLTLLTVLVVGWTTSSATAQVDQAPAMQEATPRMTTDDRKADRQAKKEKLYADLELTDEQAEQMDAINNKHRESLKALREVSREERRSQAKELKESHLSDVAEILDEAQLAKYKEALGNRKSKMKRKRRKGGR